MLGLQHNRLAAQTGTGLVSCSLFRAFVYSGICTADCLTLYPCQCHHRALRSVLESSVRLSASRHSPCLANTFFLPRGRSVPECVSYISGMTKHRRLGLAFRMNSCKGNRMLF